MYGIVNKAVEGLIIDRFGEETWHKVREKAGIDVDFFISTEPYDDDITYKLAISASETTGVDLGKILIIDVDTVNFAENPEELGTVINRINAELNGLFQYFTQLNMKVPVSAGTFLF